jgi:putative lipoic acid-binding regulatory protein
VNILKETDLDKLVLEYPLIWRYKIIAEAKADVERIVSLSLQDKEYSLEISKTSKKGSYKSYRLAIEVASDSDRKGILEKLREHKDIKFVL